MSRKLRKTDLERYQKGIEQGNTILLSRAITLVESQKPEHRSLANELINLLMHKTGKAQRIGISGVPGAGKSSFIEHYGMTLVNQGHKVAVLAVDPTSAQTSGSILGDKTRMEELSRHQNAYIRPSAAGDSLGGVARKTREAMLLCEAAGFDFILVETVGVGQSEVAVARMVDFFLLLTITGGGDELQGMKRGVMEMADLIGVNKADGDNERKARQTAVELNRALSLFPKRHAGWKPKAIHISAITGRGIDALHENITQFFKQQQADIATTRQQQNVQWMHDTLHQSLWDLLYQHPQRKKQLQLWEQEVLQGKRNPFLAAQQAIQLIDP